MMHRFPYRLFRLLLLLFPASFRHTHAPEMERLYREMWKENTRPGLLGIVVFRLRLSLDMTGNALGAWRERTAGRSPALPSAIGAELRFGARRLLRSPGFTVIAVLTLALGVGANTVMFTLIHGVYLKPLPYDEPDRLVYVQEASGETQLATSYDAYQHFRDGTSSLEALGAYSGASVVLREGEDPVRLRSFLVSANLFSVLGVEPILGRGFLAEEDEPDAERVMILSHSAWHTFFGSAQDVVGRSIRAGAGTYTVIGVMPPDFRFPSQDVQCWLSLSRLTRAPTFRSLDMVGRLAAGSSFESASAEVAALGQVLLEENPDAKGGELTRLFPLHDLVVGGGYRAIFAAFAVSVGFLLLIGCANLANLLLARAKVRRKEIAVRQALGSSGLRAIFTSASEPLLLSLAGGALGLAAAQWGVEALLRLAPLTIPRSREIGVDLAVASFALGISLAAGLLIGLVSIAGSRGVSLTEHIKAGGHGSRGRPLQGAFTVVQVALTFALLVGVTLLTRTVRNLQSVDAGFEPEGALLVRITLPGSRYPDPQERLDFHDRFLERARSLPGIAAAGYTSFLPLEGSGWNSSTVRVEGNAAPSEELPIIEYDLATPEFFDAIGIDVIRGRGFGENDRVGTLPVAVVNETAARRHFPAGDAIGRRLASDTGEDLVWFTVVGVVADVRHHHLTTEATPKFYTPFTQASEIWPYFLNMIVRTTGPQPEAYVSTIRAAIREMDADGPLVEIRPLDDVVDRHVRGPRFNALLLGLFTFAALALATLGLYAVLAFAVADRHKEIGLRMALGAQGRAVRREILMNGLRLTAVGMLIGIPLALGLGRVMTAMLFGVGSYDSPTLVGVALLLTGVATLACMVPSLRASRTDPMVALREE